VGDAVVEFDPDGGVLNQWHAFDVLDPMREGDQGEFNNPYWIERYPEAGALKDWTHSNAVVPDDRDGTIVVSSRTQNWVWKFNRNDGGTPTVVWKLGQGGDFTLTNANETFQYGQHGLNILPNGNLMMFDNGNNRPAADGGINPFSRALEYSLDTTNMTATIVWQYQESPPFYAPFLGSSYLLDNGDVLLCASLVDDPTQQAPSPTNLKYARIMEVTHDAAPTKVLEYEIRQELGSVPSDATFSGYSVYRATRVPSLY
jgi:arylsulfate sulfotransferase